MEYSEVQILVTVVVEVEYHRHNCHNLHHCNLDSPLQILVVVVEDSEVQILLLVEVEDSEIQILVGVEVEHSELQISGPE